MLQHRGIQNFDNFQKSIKNFADFYPRIKGASDIDFFYERNGNFLILEDKTYQSNMNLELFYGEMKALLSLWNLSDKILGFICAHNTKYENYRIINFTDIDMKQMKNIDGVWKMNFKITPMYNVYTKKELVEEIGLFCDSFEKKSLNSSKRRVRHA